MGTLVLTENGYKNIEDVEVGDKIIATDLETGETAVKEGLIDNLGSLNDALSCLYDMIEQNQNSKN